MELSIYGGTVYLNGGASSYDQHVIWVHQNAVLNLYGGAIVGTGSNKQSSLKGITALGWDSYINLYDGKISLSGGAELTGVFVSGSGPLLTMSGGTIDIKRNTTTQIPNAAASYGIHNYYMTAITGGTIEGADVGVWNAYYTSSGYCNVSGTAVIRGIAAGIRNTAPLTVDGGSISGKYGIYYGGASTVKDATVNGGVITGTDTGIYCLSKAALTVNGGEISGKRRGIEINTTTASLTMTGGSVASEGTGVLNSGTTTVKGGTIDAGEYGISHGGTALKMSENPSVFGDTADLYLAADKYVTIEKALTPDQGTFRVRSGKTPNTASPVRITDNWYNFHGATPVTSVGTTDLFASVDGYSVGVMNTGTVPAGTTDNNEVYLYVPEYAITALAENCTVTGVPEQALPGLRSL